MSAILPEVNLAIEHRPLASLGARLLGQIIDWAIAVGIFLLAIPLANVSETLALVPVIGCIGYYLLCDGMPNGQSLAKRLLKIAVIDSDNGKPCSYGQSAVRNITQVLGILDWLWIFGPKSRRAGDVLAHTIVVKVA